MLGMHVEEHVGFLAKCPLFLPDFTPNCDVSTNLNKIPKYEISFKYVQLFERITSQIQIPSITVTQTCYIVRPLYQTTFVRDTDPITLSCTPFCPIYPIQSTYLWLYSPCGPGPLFQFLNPIHSRQDSLDVGSARRMVDTYIQNNINTE
jgi:hypothetical protein